MHNGIKMSLLWLYHIATNPVDSVSNISPCDREKDELVYKFAIISGVGDSISVSRIVPSGIGTFAGRQSSIPKSFRMECTYSFRCKKIPLGRNSKDIPR
jgi:hypothetical protein